MAIGFCDIVGQFGSCLHFSGSLLVILPYFQIFLRLFGSHLMGLCRFALFYVVFRSFLDGSGSSWFILDHYRLSFV